ncbi:hypothetical protein [uncultured Paraglaciecola sp.]|uniref:hypothetical protein n=1 Tax=uncultured Paraglaciecola sp. TaxID=1765024 RepID=UPI00260A2E82|nr:hypothetical protein [uncultured Paraglaciecola sp.]
MASKATLPLAQAEATKTVSGYAIQFLGFIPVPKDDLRRQISVAEKILELESSDEPKPEIIAELLAMSHEPNIRAQSLNKRFPVSEANAMLGDAAGADDGEEGDPEGSE